jgi:hypothetical protein
LESCNKNRDNTPQGDECCQSDSHVAVCSRGGKDHQQRDDGQFRQCQSRNIKHVVGILSLQHWMSKVEYATLLSTYLLVSDNLMRIQPIEITTQAICNLDADSYARPNTGHLRKTSISMKWSYRTKWVSHQSCNNKCIIDIHASSHRTLRN